MKKIKKLSINLFPEGLEDKYKKAKAKYIANYKKYEKGYSTGFFSYKSGGYVKKPDIAKAKWNEEYPNGFKDWRVKHYELSTQGEQNVINKINELVKAVNKLK